MAETLSWKKLFWVKASLLTIYLYARAFKKGYPTRLLKVPSPTHYREVSCEDYLTCDYLSALQGMVGEDPRLADRIVAAVRKESDALLAHCQKFVSYEAFIERYERFLSVCDFPVFIEKAVEDRLRSVVSPEDFPVLAGYRGMSFRTEEQRDYLRALLSDAKEEHARRYAWTGYHLLLGDARIDFSREVRDARAELSRIENEQQEKERRYDKTLAKYPLAREAARQAQALIAIREYRFVAFCKAGLLLRPFFERIGKGHGLSYEDMLHLTPEEFASGFWERGRINAREKAFAVELSGGRITVYDGDALAAYRRLVQRSYADTDSLSGIGVVPGLVRGRAHRLEEPEPLAEGEILVVRTTTPAFFPLMRKATAIVTDLGGLTSHAAIYARELGMPCVIGTDHATEVFSTGDLLEVDGKSGKVRRLRASGS